jgi:hypothetical protein
MPKTSAQKDLQKHWAKQAREAQKREAAKQPQKPETKSPTAEKTGRGSEK